MKGRSWVWAVASGVFLVSGLSCSGPARQMAGEEQTVDTSREDKPKWLGSEWCPKKRVCAHGTRTRASALEHGRSDAQADAMKQFGRMLESKAKSQFSNAREERGFPQPGEDPQTDNLVKDFFTMASKITVQDVKQEDFYFRKYKALGDDERYRYYIDYDCLLSIPEATWKKKVTDLLNKAQAKAKEAGLVKLDKELEQFGKDMFNNEEE